MSTSDRAADASPIDPLVNALDISGARAAVQAGLPDPAAIARLASEMFREFSHGPAAPPSAPAGVTGLALPSAGFAPSETQARALASQAGSQASQATTQPGDALGSATRAVSTANAGAGAPVTGPIGGLNTSAAPAVPGVPGAPAVPGVAGVPLLDGLPGGFSAGDFGAAGDFGFLSEVRSLFAAAPAAPVHIASAPTAPPAPAIAGLPAIPAGSVPPAALPGAAGLPQHLGAVAHEPPGLPSSNDLLGSLNPLEAFDGVPIVAPVGTELGGLSANDFADRAFDVNAIRRDFPILQERVNGRPLVWLDNAATTQKPQAVIDRLAYFYQHENSNIHRAAHTLAARATDAYEAAREKVRRFLNAPSVKEIIFVRGATEGVNLVAQSWGKKNIQEKDEIVITHLEHHANIVPWQMLCAEKGARLRVAPVDDSGQVLLDEYEKLLNSRTKLVALTQVSNALGTVVPVQAMAAAAHRVGAKVLIDGAQAVSHFRVDVQAYDCDFYVFSGHKLFAPTGIGAVYGKSEILDATPPYQGGGNMIADVTFEKTLYQPPPWRFEAGTGNIADAVGLGAAIDYLERIGMANIARYEHDLLVYGIEALSKIPGLKLIGTAKEKASVLSFVLDGFKTEEVGAALSQEGIAVRSGHHCAQPILRRFGLESTVRPSLAFYNTCDEIDALVKAIWNLKTGRHPGLT